MGKIYAILGVIAAAIAAIFIAFAKGAQSGANKANLKVSNAALKQKTKSNQVMIDGLIKEQEVRNETVDTDNRDHFTRK